MLTLYKNRYFTDKTLWIIFSFFVISYYLWPLLPFTPTFYTIVFDNLDSVVAGFKILSESSKIFAPSTEIIPNMLNGLPRSSYSSEYNVLLWLYYLFKPQTAYAINEIIVHTTAFFSMYIFLKKYVIDDSFLDKYSVLFVSSLYFLLLPIYASEGITIAVLPLVTYSLLNIKNHISSKWDWILLATFPFYSSFIFLYVFYISMAGIYMLWDWIKHKKLNISFLLALILVGSIFLLVEYRLVLSVFSPTDFISHRTEFNIYFNRSLLTSYLISIKFFLDGWMEHSRSLVMPILLPFIIVSMLLSFTKRRFDAKESIFIFAILSLLYLVDFWQTVLTNVYTLPLIFLLSSALFFKDKRYRLFSLLIVFQILLALFNGFCSYDGFSFIKENFPFFKMFNLSRLAFIQTFIWGIVFALSIDTFIKKIAIGKLLVLLLLVVQIYYSLQVRFFQSKTSPAFATFQEYYAPQLFEKLKNYIPEPLEKVHFLNYGIEPAVAQYNKLYTIDGYSTNYPLFYKKHFESIQKECFKKSIANTKMYKRWGSKVYLMCIDARIENYKMIKDRNITIRHASFDTKVACELNANYLISAYNIDMNKNTRLRFVHSFRDNNTFWNIWLYRLVCKKE